MDNAVLIRKNVKIMLLVVLSLTGLVLLISSCQQIKKSEPILPIFEYEKLLVGRLDANYVGNDNCLAACHVHDEIRRNFEASTMGAQLSSDSGMPMVDCEACHGPGSLAIEGLTPEKVAEDARQGKQTACDFNTFIDIGNLPPTAQSLLCLRCHTANATFNLHNWNVGAHAAEDVTCIDCHDIHEGADLIVAPRDVKDICYTCHVRTRAEFSLRSRHPVNEGRLFCTDCHNQHGTENEMLLREETIKDTCTKCHAEYEGPFAFEHADLMEDCGSCHFAHGSPNDNLLITQETFLCMQCHVGHKTSAISAERENRTLFYSRCTNCHSQIHGSDTPSPSGKGKFIN